MKKYITLIAVLTLTLSACNKWLDVTPENQPTEEQIFASSEGTRSALNGLYRAMASPSLYGKDMTFGIVDAISQQYDLNRGPQVTQEEKYIAAGNLQYDNSRLMPDLDKMWLDAFNVIANANNIIQKVQEKPIDFFPEGEMEKNMIHGEALAVRAMLHFDMLRLYAPAPVNDDGANYVPYVDVYPNTIPTPIAVAPFLERVIEDLEAAQKLVVEWDTSAIGKGTLYDANSRFYNSFHYATEIYNKHAQYEDFFKGRGYRLHHYAIKALLARVYNYKGDQEKAFEYASAVMNTEIADTWGGKGKPFASDSYNGAMSTSWDSKTDLKTGSNLIFALHNAKAVDEFLLENHFKPSFSGDGSYPTWFVINSDAQKTFESYDGTDESATDYRSRFLIYKANSQHPISGKYYISTNIATREKNAMVVPAIRSTEMRYIIAEYQAKNGDFASASQTIAAIRSVRGLSSSRQVSNWQEFQEELIRDARREYISEGQLFYLYKRLNAPVNFGKGKIRPFTKSEYLLPIPTINI